MNARAASHLHVARIGYAMWHAGMPLWVGQPQQQHACSGNEGQATPGHQKWQAIPWIGSQMAARAQRGNITVRMSWSLGAHQVFGAQGRAVVAQVGICQSAGSGVGHICPKGFPHLQSLVKLLG